MIYKRWIPDDPSPEIKEKEGLKVVLGGTGDYYGACSLEKFSSASSLSLTHEDASGFLDYPTSFPGRAANFWFGDAGVKVWAYEETYDNWQDLYGMDAVMVFYHSGHGNMDGNGVFQAPLGSIWDGRDWAFSNRMAFSNERLRYLFWSTCLSLRVSGGHSPVKSWAAPNKGGLRMLFGYETTSVDNANYGKYFWDEWKKGKTFGRAFLDASWRISHSQVPVVMASGANQADAISRLNNERFFTTALAAKGWYQWMWLGTLKEAKYSTQLPVNAGNLILNSKLFNDERISIIAKKVGIPVKNAGSIFIDTDGNRLIKSKQAIVNVNNQGALNISFGEPNIKNPVGLDEKKALKIANELITDLQFNQDMKLAQGSTRQKLTCGVKTEGSGEVKNPQVVETIIQFRQVVDGIESINSDHGLIAISIDNDGKVTNIYNSTKAVEGVIERPKSGQVTPPENAKSVAISKDKMFENKFGGLINRSLAEGVKASGKINLLKEKAGYDFSGNMGTLVHQKDVEIYLDDNFVKRYKVRVPYFEL